MTTTIKLDIDHKMRLPEIEELEKRIAFVADILELPLELQQIWPTRKGHHVILTSSARLAPLEVVTLQALLGSDWHRETFNFARVRVLGDAPAFWQLRHNVLYSEKL